MIKLRNVLTTLLRSYHPNVNMSGKSKSRVYFQNSPDDSPFPYIVFDLPNSFIIDQQEIFNLDVDIWDNKDDTTELETLADMLWKKLNCLNHEDEEIQFSIYRENRLPPIDDDPRIKRRKLIFQLRYFDRRLFE